MQKVQIPADAGGTAQDSDFFTPVTWWLTVIWLPNPPPPFKSKTFCWFPPQESTADSYISQLVGAVSCQFADSTLHLHFYHSLSSVDTRLSPLLSLYQLILFFPSQTLAAPPILSLARVPRGSASTQPPSPPHLILVFCMHLTVGRFWVDSAHRCCFR